MKQVGVFLWLVVFSSSVEGSTNPIDSLFRVTLSNASTFERGEAALGLGKEYFKQGTYDSSLYFFQSAIEILEGNPQLETVADAYFWQGYQAYHLRKIVRSIKAYDLAGKCYEKQGNHDQLGQCYWGIAKGYSLLGLASKAETNYNKAISILVQSSTSSATLSRLYLDIGLLYLNKEDYIQSNNFLQLAISNSSGLGLFSSRIHNWLGELNRYQSNWKIAIDEYRTAISIAKATNEVLEVAYPLANIGQVHESLGQLDSAEYNYQKAFSLLEHLNYTHASSLVHNNLGGLYLRQARYREAKEHIERALTLSVDLEDRVEYHRALDHALLYYSAVGDLASHARIWQAYQQEMVPRQEMESQVKLAREQTEIEYYWLEQEQEIAKATLSNNQDKIDNLEMWFGLTILGLCGMVFVSTRLYKNLENNRKALENQAKEIEAAKKAQAAAEEKAERLLTNNTTLREKMDHLDKLEE